MEGPTAGFQRGQYNGWGKPVRVETGINIAGIIAEVEAEAILKMSADATGVEESDLPGSRAGQTLKYDCQVRWRKQVNGSVHA